MGSWILAVAFVLNCVPAFSGTWPPVPVEELSARTPRVEKGAHAEVNLWDVRITHGDGARRLNYLRIKVFDSRGVEMMSKIDIPYTNGTRISAVIARTTKPDGQEIWLSKDSVFDRVIIKGRDVRIRAASFALPALEPGAVVEYGWQETKKAAYGPVVLDLQREIPVNLVRFHIKPVPESGFRYIAYQTQPLSPKSDENGYYSAAWSAMPALAEEPDMPGLANIKAWIFGYYDFDGLVSPDEYWRKIGKALFLRTKQQLKIDGNLKKTAARITEGAITEEQKLAKIFTFCRTQIQRVGGLTPVSDTDESVPEEQRKFKANKDTAATLKQGAGTDREIDMLFIALALASGIDARFALNSDREIATFSPQMANAWFMNSYEVAVRVGDKWLFYDPAASMVPMGMLRWQEEGTYALIGDPNEPIMIRTPVTPAGKSVQTRTGYFTVSDDGALDGLVRFLYTGHLAIAKRSQYLGRTKAERIEDLTRELKRQFTDAEITEVSHEDLLAENKGFSEAFRMHINGYAQRTGKRLFFRPSVFQTGVPARYEALERKYPIGFHYPWIERDHVTFTLPEGLELDRNEMPSPLNLGIAGRFETSATYNAADRKVFYSRDFVFLPGTKLFFDKELYPALKTAFSGINAADQHSLTFKQRAASATK